MDYPKKNSFNQTVLDSAPEDALTALNSIFGRANTERFIVKDPSLPTMKKVNEWAEFPYMDRLPDQPELEDAYTGIIRALEDSRTKNLNSPYLAEAKNLFNLKPWNLNYKLPESFYSLTPEYINIPFLDPIFQHTLDDLLKLPSIAENEARLTADPDMKLAFNILRDCFHIYFTGKWKNEETFAPFAYFVPLWWATNYKYARGPLYDLMANLKNKTAIDGLKARFKDRCKNMKINEVFEFDYTNDSPVTWHGNAYQFRLVKHPMDSDTLDIPQYRALGDFAIRALPKGYVERLENGEYRICLNEVHIFIDDGFNFEGGAPLGYWDFKNLRYKGSIDARYKSLGNGSFQQFREATGYGRNFRVVSPLHKVKDFKADCWRLEW